MKKLKVIILIGIPGSGKTTLAKKYLLQDSNAVRVSRDDFRLMFRNQVKVEPKIETLINKAMENAVLTALSMKCNVILDNTNLKASVIERWKELLLNVADIEFVVLDISLQKALANNAKRENPVDEAFIREKYEEFKILVDSVPLQNISKNKKLTHLTPNYSSNLPQAVIFDIDGTLALMNDREPFDWDKVHKDDVNDIVAEQVKFHKSLGRTIIIVSGRDEVCRKDTQEWLDLYEIEYDKLYMRPKNDYRKDTVIKTELYEDKIKSKYNVLCVYDDRQSVVEAWRDMGLFVFNVSQFKHIF